MENILSTLLSFWTPFLLFMVIGAWIFWRRYNEVAVLLKEHTFAKGLIKAINKTPQKEFICYQFDASDGKTYSKTVLRTIEDRQQLHVGDNIDIAYAPSNPKISATREYFERLKTEKQKLDQKKKAQ